MRKAKCLHHHLPLCSASGKSILCNYTLTLGINLGDKKKRNFPLTRKLITGIMKKRESVDGKEIQNWKVR